MGADAAETEKLTLGDSIFARSRMEGVVQITVGVSKFVVEVS